MNRKYILLFALCIGFLFSCHEKNNTPTPVGPIVGTWALQQEHVDFYQDTTALTDTMLTASPGLTYGKAQFNANGTYSTSGIYLFGNVTTLTGPPPSVQNSAGKYSYSNNILTLNSGLAGWYSYVFGSTGPISGIVYSIHITQLTGTKLTIHMQNRFVTTTVTGSHTFDEELDYYYTK